MLESAQTLLSVVRLRVLPLLLQVETSLLVMTILSHVQLLPYVPCMTKRERQVVPLVKST